MWENTVAIHSILKEKNYKAKLQRKNTKKKSKKKRNSKLSVVNGEFPHTL